MLNLIIMTHQFVKLKSQTLSLIVTVMQINVCFKQNTYPALSHLYTTQKALKYN